MYLRSFRFRITLLFTVIFLLCSVILYVASYIIISASIKSEEYAFLESKLLEYWAIYQTGSLDLLINEISLQRFMKEEKLYMVRIAGRYNNTLYLFVPDHWRGFNFYELENQHSIKEGEIIRLASHETAQVLDISSLYLPDQHILQIGISNTQREKTLAQFRQAFLLVIVPLLVLSFFGGMIFSSRFLWPVKSLINTTKEIIRTGRMNMRVPPRKSKDELDELIGLFNRMLEKIENLMNSLRQTLDNVSHEIRTPLTRLRGIAEMALRPPSHKKNMQKALVEGIAESEHILYLLNTLLDISQAESGIITLNKQRLDISELILDMLDFYHYLAEEKDIFLDKQLARGLFIFGDLNRIRQIISGLLENAFKYTPAKGKIEVATRTENTQAVIHIKNTGPGIKKDELTHIWKRFYRSKHAEQQQGIGLGLSLVKAVVEAHGGEISVQSKVGEYTAFQVKLPCL
ncbi:MAG: HAMP domain-containing histidine kinase [Spirochaetales bacterium]|nr:HAMP domain-containing histidine kinase [Spirochaetales bacterium]